MKTVNQPMLSVIAVGTLLMCGACNREEAAAPSAATNTTTPAPGTAETTDAGITTNVQAKYYADDQVRGRNVSVTAEAGVVTLRGAVESEAARHRAVALARDVQGVKEVKDELTVKTATTAERPDVRPAAATEGGATGTAGRDGETVEPAWITTKIQAQYFINPEVKPWNVDVTTASGGVVTLEGEVDTAADRAEAVRIARETEGVTRVENRLRVKGEATTNANTSAIERPDLFVTAKIQSKYFLDDLVKLRNIDVETASGTVTLTGTVASEGERRQAVALARSTEGVRQVTDELHVDAAAVAAERPASGDVNQLAPVAELTRPDPWITMKVQAQFFLDPEIKGHEIDVDTTRGVVLLKGTVESAQQRQQAERIARDTEGVTRVVNQLTVGTSR